MALAHGYALPFVTQKVVGDYASDNAAAAARAIASGATKEAAGSCLDARAINLQMRVPQRTDTNLLTNSAMAGATGSVLPTKWVSGSVNGLTVTISSAFTSAGFQAIDWTVSGTADSDGTLYIGCEPNDNTNAIPASIGQQYIGAMSLGKQAGTIPATMVMQVLGQKSSDGTVIETANSSTDLNGLVSGSLTRVNTAVLSIASVSSDRVNFRLTADVAALDVISFTIRIAAPQVERNDRISPYITTTTGAASRVTGQPSLLIVPQLTRAGVVYPQLPVVSGADFTFTRATTATRVNASGLIESVASGLLRLDYPVTGGCPAALIEASGTNLVLQSENFTTTWAATNISVSANSTGTLDPYGTNVADLLTATASGSARVIQAFSFVSGTTYTYSCFAKAGTGFFGMTMENGGVASGTAVIWNLTTGAFVVSGTAGSNYTLQAHNIESYGNGWYRCSMRVLVGASVAGNIRVNTSNGTMSTAIIQSDSGNTAYVFGAQVETGAIPTSYIPTTTASATRNADVCSVSGVSGYIGQTEGTIYAEVDLRNLGVETYFIRIDDGGNTNIVSLRKLTSNNVRSAIIAPTTSGTINISSAAFTAGIIKIAFAYKSGEIALCVNGVNSTANGTFVFSASLNRIHIGSNAAAVELNDRIRAAAIYTTRLSNDQLANITRLT